MSALNDRAAVEEQQTYIGTARRSEPPLLCPDSYSYLSTNYHNSISGLLDFTVEV